MPLSDTLSFGANTLDRAAHHRSDPEVLRAFKETGNFLPLWRGKPLVHQDADGGQRLAWVGADHPILQESLGTPIFLGLSDETPVFACTLPDWEGITPPDTNSFLDTDAQTHPAAPQGAGFVELRMMLTSLTPTEAEIAATARAIHEWHRSHQFCSCCGERSESAEAGWQRDCPACGRMHFPRTDPVVIMLITDGERGNRVLIGRSPGWPEGMYSLLAGFMEPGETIEAATRREVVEETGVKVGAVSYLASQPWPFPASLMIGTHGVALTDEITLDPKELEDARWMTREEMMQAFAGLDPDVKPARRGSIAHYLLRNWLADQPV